MQSKCPSAKACMQGEYLPFGRTGIVGDDICRSNQKYARHALTCLLRPRVATSTSMTRGKNPPFVCFNAVSRTVSAVFHIHRRGLVVGPGWCDTVVRHGVAIVRCVINYVFCTGNRLTMRIADAIVANTASGSDSFNTYVDERNRDVEFA